MNLRKVKQSSNQAPFWNKENQNPNAVNEPSAEQNTIKKRKTKKDASYSAKNYSFNDPEGKKTKSNDNWVSFPAMMFDTDTTFKNDKGEDTEIKTSVMIDFDALYETNQDTNINWDELGQELIDAFKKISGFRPIEPTEFSDTISPVKGTTPDGKTILTRVKKIGFLSFYTNKPITPLNEITLQSKLDIQSEFFNSKNFKAIIEVHDLFKQQEALITRALLKKSKQENLQITSRSQNRVVVKEGKKEKEGSANNYVNATGLFSLEIPFKWQWLHMVPHFVWGELSQSIGVLVAGSRAANADMASVETQLKYLSRKYPNGFRLIVKADLVPETHIGITMKYFIKTNDFYFPFDFNLQTPNQPHITQASYIEQVIKKIYEEANKNPGKIAKRKLQYAQYPWMNKSKPSEEKPAENTTTATNKCLNNEKDTDKVESDIEKNRSNRSP